MNKSKLDFAVFCIENVAEYLNINGADVYNMLASKSGILDDYIISNYETLHTQGKEYIVNDLIEYMKEKGLLQ